MLLSGKDKLRTSRSGSGQVSRFERESNHCLTPAAETLDIGAALWRSNNSVLRRDRGVEIDDPTEIIIVVRPLPVIN
jgi:hypothetical protein